MFVRVLVLGSNGMLGTYITKYLSENNKLVFAYMREDLDAKEDNKEVIKEKIDKYKPDVVVNCIGLIKQRDVSNVDMIKVNSIFPLILSEVCEELKVPLIHITTDCVFDGSIGDYNETSIHTATDVYGKSKSLGEPQNATVIRTSIIGEEPNGKKLSLLEWFKNNKEGVCNGFINHFWNGVTCLQLAKVINKIIDVKDYWKGVKHVFSSFPVNKFQLLSFIKNEYCLPIIINPLFTEKNCNRTLTSIYDLTYNIPSIDVQIKEQKGYL